MNAEDLVITFKKNMANLSKTERRRAIRAAAFDDAAGSSYEVECCPRCGSVAIVKKGKAKNGEQRYLCRDCGRTFGMGSERILGTSKLPKETWMAYAECFVLMLPLRECAKRCHVCLKTAYAMRHRLIECLSAHCPHSGPGGAAAASSTRPIFPSLSRATTRRGRSRCRVPPDIAASRCTSAGCRASRSAL